jgi:hypothetical protein
MQCLEDIIVYSRRLWSIQSSIATFYSFCGCVGKLSNINIYHLQLKIYLFRTVGTYGGSECKPNAVCGL